MAETLCTALESRGMSCWLAIRDVPAGGNFQEAVFKAIEAARVILLIFTTHANNSEEIKKELALASQMKHAVIPLRWEDVNPDAAFRYELSTRQWIDMFENWERALEQLRARLQAVLGLKTPSPHAPPFPGPSGGVKPARQQNAPLPFDLDAARRMILAGEAPPVEWRPLIQSISLEGRIKGLSPLAGLGALKRLSVVDNATARDEMLPVDLTPLEGLTALQDIHLSWLIVASLGPLVNLVTLRRLILAHMEGTEHLSDFGQLRLLTDLEELVLFRTNIVDLAPLSRLTKLVELVLRRTDAHDYRVLSRLKNLQKLDLYWTSIRDLSPLGHLSELQELKLGGWTAQIDSVEAMDLAPLANLASLQKLDLDGLTVDISPLAQLPGLVELNATWSKVLDFKAIARLKKLQKLDIPWKPMRDLSPLIHLSELRELRVSTGLDEDNDPIDLAPLARHPSLRKLTLETVRDFTPLANIESLRELDLTHHFIFPGETPSLAPLARLPNLRKIIVSKGSKDRALAHGLRARADIVIAKE
jgi:Leucine-rich repeat (LRR) protein